MVKLLCKSFPGRKSKKEKQHGKDVSFDKGKAEHYALYEELRAKALEVSIAEPFIAPLLEKTFLHPKVNNFNSAISRAIGTRLITSCGNDPILCPEQMTKIIEDAMKSPILEYGVTMADAVYEDIVACKGRDPACKSGLEIVLYYKGFASLVCHRAARRHYSACNKDGDESARYVSLWLQSQASDAFGVDIHPAAEIGSGVFFDHATGLVIGETAKVGNNCTILHGVTLGGTGKVSGDRHPKVGDNVLIGAGTSILGNITIGNGAKIGAGSIVLMPIPHGATAVGAPAKIIGWAKEHNPGSMVDNSLQNVLQIGGRSNESSRTARTVSTRTVSTEASHDFSNEIGEETSDLPQDFEKEKTIDDSISSSEVISTKDSESETQNETDSEEDFFRRFKMTRGSSMCVFPMHLGKKQGILTYSSLYNGLSDICTEAEIGEVYLGLLKKNECKAYICRREAAMHFPSIAQQYTKLDAEKCHLAQKRLSLVG